MTKTKYVLADKQLSAHALKFGGTQIATVTGQHIPRTGFDNIHQTNVTLELIINHFVVKKVIYKGGLIERTSDRHLSLADARKDFMAFRSKHGLNLVDQTAITLN